MLIVCYVGLLLPALGFLNIYFMRYSLVADHWQYAAMIVPCAVFAAAVATFGRRRRCTVRGTGYMLCLGLLATLAGLTWRQSRMYSNIETCIGRRSTGIPIAGWPTGNLALALAARGQVEPRAIVHYRKALEIKPDDASAL